MNISKHRAQLTDRAATTGYAMVGATDLAVEQVRTARASVRNAQGQALAVTQHAGHRMVDLTKGLRDELTMPGLTQRANQVGEQAEDAFVELAQRGRDLVERIRAQQTSQALLDQGKYTISRAKATVTSGRKTAQITQDGVADTAQEAKEAAQEALEDTTQSGSQSAKSAAKRGSGAAKRAGASSRAAADTTASMAKGTATSAAKTADKAKKSGKNAAAAVGS